MARRRRSLLGNQGKPATVAPTVVREHVPPSAPPPQDPVEDEITLSEADEPDDGLIEDDAPLLGSDLDVPPSDGDDAMAPPNEVIGHMHAPPPDISETTPDPDVQDILVLFDENPSDTPALLDDDVSVEDSPPGFDSSTPLRGQTPEVVPSRVETPAPGFDDQGDGDAFFRDEDSDPPTEEATSAAAEDFMSLYRAPMNVPEPPPIPGILDRFTPAVARRGTGPSDGRPDFVPTPPGGAVAPEVTAPRGLWDETPVPANQAQGRKRGTPTPPPAYRDSAPQAPATPFYRDPYVLAAAGFAALAGGLVIAILVLVLPGPPADSGVAPQVQPTMRPVMPGLRPAATEPAAEPGDDPVVDPGAMPSADPGLPPTGMEPASGSPNGSMLSPAIMPPSAPVIAAPKPAPRTTPKPKEPAPSAARMGTIKVVASRSVLVSVNGAPVGMTPLELERPEGAYTIAATIKGKRREERIELQAGKIRTIEF